jgi:hypothetical protein
MTEQENLPLEVPHEVGQIRYFPLFRRSCDEGRVLFANNRFARSNFALRALLSPFPALLMK